ncbi:RHS repeat-associated core domain-containing protein [Botrimarina sp.]|uniref:RHS repeat-associated core domain-containing protein n=1 Tax=Botrimarina sp. TaxID=2795802 RepID=UPI0032EF9E6D
MSIARLEATGHRSGLPTSVDEVGQTNAPFAGLAGDPPSDTLLGATADDFLGATPVYYAGHQLDPLTGLYDMQARWYDPATQRFLSEDPLGPAGGSDNLYVYAGGDPVNRVDPDGRAFFTVGALVTAGAYLATQGGFAAAETAVEYGATNALGTAQDVADFSTLGTFGKNFAINVATFGVGGKIKTGSKLARLAGGAALYAGRQGIEVAGDTAYDVGYHGRDLGGSLALNTIGSIAGEAAGRAIGVGARSFYRNVGVFERSTGSLAPAINATRQRVLANIAESRAARQSSNFELHIARESQIGAPYGGVDNFRFTTLEQGSLVYGGVPGQSAYYTDFATVRASGLNAPKLFESLQVAPHPVIGYRPGVQAYRVTKPLRVPSSQVLANPQFGSGGGNQFFIRNFESKLEPVRQFPLSQ